jgi:glycosyltransferase involved in cell wall biosynthesis
VQQLEARLPFAASFEPELDSAVSVIIPARNAAATLGDQLQALSRQTFNSWWEMIIVDNGSRDATVQIAQSWHRRLPRLRVIHAPTARGAAGARNAGVRAARGDLLLFCDADDVVDPNWVTQLVKGLHNYPAVGGRIDRHRLNDPTTQAWRPARPADALPDHFRFLPYIQGANCGIHRKVWSELGGFDEQFSHSEDVAFFWRVQLAGHEVGFIPDAVVCYRYRSSLSATARQNFSYGKSHAQLYKQFADAGMPRSNPAIALQEWGWLVIHMPNIVRSRQARGSWLARAARAAGRLAGCLHNRTLYL